jgi:oligopeptide transport system substrate-binding protein
VYSADFRFDKAQEAYEQAFALWEDLRAAETPPVEAESPVMLRFAMAEPLTLDPALAGDDATTLVIGQLMEGLLEIDEAWGVIPALARSWDVSDDGRRYTFHLRRGWTWSDGHQLTAADFEYAWKRNLALASDSPAGLLLYVIENARLFAEGKVDGDAVGVRAVQPLTLEFRLAQPASYFPQLLTHPVTFPLPRWVVEGAGQPWTDPENFVGNGPYRMEGWTKDHGMVLVLNPRYRGLRRGNAQRIEAPAIVAYPPLLEAFEAGALDGISLLQADPGTTSEIQATYRRRFSASPVLSTFFLAFHTGRPPFDAPAVRKALIHAVDREALLRASGRARFRVAMGGFLPPGMPGHSPVIGLGHDPERARALLREAGFDGGRGFPEVECLFKTNRNPLAAF